MITLNPSQHQAAIFLASGWQTGRKAVRFPLVDGPPGTGKTQVVVAAAEMFLREHPKGHVAVLTPTNVAAARATGLAQEAGVLALHLVESRSRRSSPWSVPVGDPDTVDLVTRRQLLSTSVLAGTLDSARRILAFRKNPCLILIDEVSQVSWADWHVLSNQVDRALGSFFGWGLVGDPLQLPLVTTQPELAINMLLWTQLRRPGKLPHTLTTEYRMNEAVLLATNALRQNYGAPSLVADPSVALHTLSGFSLSSLPAEIPQLLAPELGLLIIDSDPLRGQEAPGIGLSWAHPQEAKLAVQLANWVETAYGLEPSEKIAIITPYQAQVAEIQKLRPRCRVLTAWSAQGQEWPVVIATFVRANPRGDIGFLLQQRANLYVTVSRAQYKLILIMSTSTFSQTADGTALINAAQCCPPPPLQASMVSADPGWLP